MTSFRCGPLAAEKSYRRYIVSRAGNREAVAIAVRNVSGRRRWSKLREWLGVGTGAQVANLP